MYMILYYIILYDYIRLYYIILDSQQFPPLLLRFYPSRLLLA